MTKEKAKLIAKAIAVIAEGAAKTAISEFCDNTTNAVRNSRVTQEAVQHLEELLQDLLPPRRQ